MAGLSAQQSKCGRMLHLLVILYSRSFLRKLTSIRASFFYPTKNQHLITTVKHCDYGILPKNSPAITNYILHSLKMTVIISGFTSYICTYNIIYPFMYWPAGAAARDKFGPPGPLGRMIDNILHISVPHYPLMWGSLRLTPIM